MVSNAGTSSAEEEMALQAARARLLNAAPAKVLVGRYTLRERVGRGASANVWRAHDPKLDRDVALKLVERWGGQGVPPAEARARVVREARAVASLNHPNIVPIFDVGSFEAPGGEEGVFLAMELLRGQSVRSWLREAPRDAAAVVDVFDQAARALHAAHATGVVHRDFKPANAMVDPEGRVRVIDFGLARRVDAEVSVGDRPASGVSRTDTSLTATGSVMGTPAFMAPEQHEGGDVGPKSDQFALCVALFEGLAGRRPFQGNNLVELAEAKQRLAIDAGALASIPALLRKPILRGLQPDPSDRWPDVEALRRALRPPGRGRRWHVVGGLCLVVMGVGVWAQTTTQTMPQTAVAWIGERVAHHSVARALDAAMNEVRAVRALAVEGRMHQAEERASAFLVRRDPVLRPATAAMLVQRGGLRRVRGAWTAAAEDFEQAFHLAIEAGAHEAELDAACELCRHASERAPQEASRWLGNAEAAFARGSGGELQAAKLAGIQSEDQARRLELEDADDTLTSALGRLQAGEPSVIETRLSLLADRALVTRRRGLMDESNGLLRAALAEGRATLGATHPWTLHAEIEWAQIEAYVGDPDEARAHAEDAVRTARKALGPSHVLVGDAHAALAQARALGDDAEGALDAFDAAEAVFNQLPSVPDRDLKLAETWTARGLTLDELDRRPEALAMLRRARDAQTRVLGASHVYSTINGNNIAMVLRHMGRLEEAETEARAVAEFFDAQPDADPSVRSFTYIQLSKTLMALERPREAHAWALKAAELWTVLDDPWDEGASAYFTAAMAAADFDGGEATRLARLALSGFDADSASAKTVRDWLEERVQSPAVSRGSAE